MLKKTLTYEDYDGNPRTEDYYFNLTKSELHEWQNSKDGGLSTLLDRIVMEQDRKEIIGYFKELIEKSYGRKSDDGKYFRKSEEILDDFTSSAAYDALYMELMSDTSKALDFVYGIVPKDIAIAARKSGDERNGVERLAENITRPVSKPA